jgi:hypothetical protein
LVMADGPVAWESKNSLQLTGTGDEYMGVWRSTQWAQPDMVTFRALQCTKTYTNLSSFRYRGFIVQ